MAVHSVCGLAAATVVAPGEWGLVAAWRRLRVAAGMGHAGFPWAASAASHLSRSIASGRFESSTGSCYWRANLCTTCCAVLVSDVLC